MNKYKTIHHSRLGLFIAKELIDEPGVLDVFNANTNLRVCKFDYDTDTYTFVDNKTQLSCYQLNELIELANKLKSTIYA